MSDMTEHKSYEHDHESTGMQALREEQASARAREALAWCRFLKTVEGETVRITRTVGGGSYWHVVSVDVSGGVITLADPVVVQRRGDMTYTHSGTEQILAFFRGASVVHGEVV